MPETAEQREQFVEDYLHTRANSNRIPGTVDVIIADCSEENVNWLHGMRRATSRRREAEDVDLEGGVEAEVSTTPETDDVSDNTEVN